MNKQFYISVSGQDDIAINLAENESVSVVLSHSTFRKEPGDVTTTFKVDGYRWIGDDMDIISWAEFAIEPGNEIKISFQEASGPGTPPKTDLRFVPEEPECSFCQKKAREVKTLIAAPFFAHICDECIETSVDIIKQRQVT